MTPPTINVINLSQVHVIVVDESQLSSDKVAIRIYDASNNLLGNILLSTDRTDTNILSVIKPVAAPPPPPPPPPPTAVPTAISLSPAVLSMPDNTPAGATVTTATVSMSDGSTYTGAIGVNTGVLFVGSGQQIVTTRAITPTDPGDNSVHNLYVSPLGFAAVKALLSVTFVPVVTPPPPPPPPPPPTLLLSLNPPAPQISDNSLAGMVVTTATVSYSDGTAPIGVTLSSNSPLFAISGMKVVLARALTSADDGMDKVIITATSANGATAKKRLM